MSRIEFSTDRYRCVTVSDQCRPVPKSSPRVTPVPVANSPGPGKVSMESQSPLELRLLRYFVATVEEGSITKAAVRLTISQPALSRAIRALERAVGVDLLVRRPQRVDPTPAGLALLDAARDLEKRALMAVSSARAAARNRPRLRVAVGTCDVLVAKDLVLSFLAANPDSPTECEVVPSDSSSPAVAVRKATSEVAIVRGPFDTTATDHQLLYKEPRVVLLPTEHQLAARSRLELADLRAEPVTRYRWMNDAEADYWAGADGDRHRWRVGAEVSSPADVLAAVRLGRAVAFIPWSEFVSAGTSPGIVARPVDGLSESELNIAWDRESTAISVAQFVAHAEKVFSDEQDAARALLPFPGVA